MRIECVVVVFGLCAWTNVVAAASPTATEEEEVLIRRGIQLRKARDDLAARAEFQKAYDLTHSPRAAAQLGLAEFALGRWDDAEGHVSESLRTPQDPWIAKYRVELDQSLATIKTHVAHVEVIGDPAGAEVYVNGRPSGRLPLTGPVAVSEGQVDVELRFPGFARGNRTVSLQGGQYQRLVIRLEPARGASTGSLASGSVDVPTATPVVGAVADGSTSASEQQSSPSTARRVIKWSTLGLSGVALATGVVATIIKETNTTTFKSLHAGGCRDRDGKAVDDAGAAVPECQASLDAYRSARPWQIVGFVGAGLFAATWLALTLTETSGGASTVAQRGDRAPWVCLVAPGAGVTGTCAFRF